MAQANRLTKLAKTYVAIESSFATTPSTMLVAFPKEGTVDLGLGQDEKENEDESVYLYDRKSTVFGLKTGAIKAEFNLAAHLSIYSGSVGPQSNYLQQLLKTAFGGHTAGSGSLVQAGASTTVVGVDTPGNFEIGQFAMFTTTAGLEPGLVVSKSASNLTVYPALTSAPASAATRTTSRAYARLLR
jgi:hypothetical protein